MTPAVWGAFLFLGLAVFLGYGFNLIFSNIIRASVASGTLSALILQGVAYVFLGYLDPFAPVAFIASTGMGIGIGYAIGVALKKKSRRPVDRS